MSKKAALAFTLLTLAACFLSFMPGSMPVVLAKSRATQQDPAAPPPLPTAPTTWALSAEVGGVTTPASVTRAAGGAGVKHVATCISFSMANSGSTFFGYGIALWNGPFGTGTVVWQMFPKIPANSTFAQSICDLNIVGTANEPMVLSFGASNTSFEEAVSLVGYDAQ